MPLINGSWNLFANGFSGTLQINGSDPSGNLDPSSTAFGNPIFGFWDEASQKLTFVRPAGGDATSVQVYDGYLMTPGVGSSVATLAGSFQAFAGTGAVAQRSVFGWLASFTPPIP